jgi:hypothetical protein
MTQWVAMSLMRCHVRGSLCDVDPGVDRVHLPDFGWALQCSCCCTDITGCRALWYSLSTLLTPAALLCARQCQLIVLNT